MACRPWGDKPLSDTLLAYSKLDPWEQSSVKFKSRHTLFVQENQLENVVHEMAAILCRPHCANMPNPSVTCTYEIEINSTMSIFLV